MKRSSQWKAYFEELLNRPGPEDPINANSHELEDNITEETMMPALSEVKEAIVALKNNRSSGTDEIPSELWKYAKDVVQYLLHELTKEIWRTDYIPEKWKTGGIVPIHKKGGRMECTNHCPGPKGLQDFHKNIVIQTGNLQ